MERKTRLLWIVIGILAVLALLVTAGGCTKAATTSSPVNKPSITTVSTPPPSTTTSTAAPAPPVVAPPPPVVTSQQAASPKPPPPAGGAPPPGGGAPPPPPGGGAPPPPPGGGAPPPPPGGGAPPPPPGGGAPPPPPGGAPAPPAAPLPSSGKMVLTSTAVVNGVIADVNSCVGVTNAVPGAPKSPPLAWTGAPAGTKSFAVIISGIKGGGDEGFMLVVYNIPSTATGLPEGLKDNLADPKIGTLGTEDTGNTVYKAPCGGSPGPWKKTVTLYALSTTPEVLDNPKSVNAAALRGAMAKITLDTATLDFNVIIK